MWVEVGSSRLTLVRKGPPSETGLTDQNPGVCPSLMLFSGPLASPSAEPLLGCPTMDRQVTLIFPSSVRGCLNLASRPFYNWKANFYFSLLYVSDCEHGMRLANLGIFSLPANSWTGARTIGLDHASSLCGIYVSHLQRPLLGVILYFFFLLSFLNRLINMKTLESVLHELQLLGGNPMNEQVEFREVSVYSLSVGAWEHGAADCPWTMAHP